MTATVPECAEGFDKMEDKGATGADRAIGVYGVDNCQTKCLSEEDCVAVDVDNNNKEACWVFTDAEKAALVENRQGIDHYARREDCPGT